MINNLVMKMKNIKKIIVLLFFLIELFLPTIIFGINFVINDYKIEKKYWSYDLNTDGFFSENEMNEEGFIEAEQRYIGDGGRNVFFVSLILGSLIFGIVYKIIFYIGDAILKKILKHIDDKSST